MNFYTIFTRTRDIHLTKDVGMLPESLAKGHADINSYLITYKNDTEYPHYGRDITRTKLVFLEKRYGKYIDGVRFIKKNASDIDVLNIYHLNLSSYLYCLAAKRYLKNTAIIYLKLDAGFDELRKLRKRGLKAQIKRRTIALSDIVTAETRRAVKEFQNEVNAKVEYLPNGVNGVGEAFCGDTTDKSDIILTVGHLGTPPKNTEFLIEAFIRSADKHDYELHLVGSCTDDIKAKIEAVRSKQPEIYKRIRLLGEITDRGVLAKEYKSAKIFAFPSKWESFGFVLLEAISAGCYAFVSDKVSLAYDLIGDGKGGRILPIDDPSEWGRAFSEIYENEPDWEALSREGYEKVASDYSWDRVADRLYDILTKRIFGRFN